MGVGALALIIVTSGIVAGTLPRLAQKGRVDAAAAEQSTTAPRVTVARARLSPRKAERVLPGTALPLFEASMFPRATGYIKARLVDIGDRVSAGQLLAVIEAPDIDDQLAQSTAALEQTRANLIKAKADLAYAAGVETRYAKLVETNTVARQEFDDSVKAADVARALVTVNEATIKVNEAEVQRFTDLQGFEKIAAPFAGVITARNIDPGDLVSANSTSKELFHVMRTDVLRVFVNVPQVFATDIKVAQQAIVYRRDDPTKQYTGKVTRTANAIEPNTRTLLTEVQVPNPDDTLRPGMYLQVKFVFDRNDPPVLIPSAALATRSDGPRVPVLDDKNQVHYRAIRIGRDFGPEIEVLSGLCAGEAVVIHPGDDLADGTVVVPVPLTK
jgi:RND family efflux transporter MFP subunit